MTDALSSRALTRPPESGPGSTVEAWRAFAAQETGRSIEGDLDKVDSRAELIALVDHTGPHADVREAPEDVEVHEAENGRPPRITDDNDRPVWAVPVKDGYVSEDELRSAEREAEKERTAQRHKDRLAQLQKVQEV